MEEVVALDLEVAAVATEEVEATEEVMAKEALAEAAGVV